MYFIKGHFCQRVIPCQTDKHDPHDPTQVCVVKSKRRFPQAGNALQCKECSIFIISYYIAKEHSKYQRAEKRKAKQMRNGTVSTFLRYRYLLQNLVTRDLKVKYRRSVLGILWSLLNPILMMLVMSAVFSTIFKNTIEYFPLYLICGQTLFGFFNEATTGALASVVGSSSLIKKVYIPKYIFPLEKVLFAFVNLLFSLVAVVVMCIVFGLPFRWTMLLFPVPILGLLLFSTGVGLLLAVCYVFFRDTLHLYTVVITILTYLTPLFYTPELLEGSIVYNVVMANPLTTYVMYFRNVVLYGTLPTIADNIACFGWGIGAIVVGLWFFHAKQDKFILHI